MSAFYPLIAAFLSASSRLSVIVEVICILISQSVANRMILATACSQHLEYHEEIHYNGFSRSVVLQTANRNVLCLEFTRI